MESLFETDSELKDRGRSKSCTCDLFWKAGPGVFDEDYHSETLADSGELIPPYFEMRLKYRYSRRYGYLTMVVSYS